MTFKFFCFQLTCTCTCKHGKVYSYPMPLPPDTPSMPELLSFSAKKLNIAVQVGATYLQFGIFLLDDTNAAIADALDTKR